MVNQIKRNGDVTRCAKALKRVLSRRGGYSTKAKNDYFRSLALSHDCFENGSDFAEILFKMWKEEVRLVCLASLSIGWRFRDREI